MTKVKNFEDSADGIWNDGEEWNDLNDNCKWDEGEEFSDIGNGVWDEGEEFVDAQKWKI